LGAELVQPYKFDDARSDRQLDLKHAGLQRAWNMDRVSNAPFPEVRLAVIVDQYSSHNSSLLTRMSLGVFVGILKANK